MISLTFPDGAVRQYEAGIRGSDLVSSIAKSLAKKTVAMVLDGVLADLNDPITQDSTIDFISREDPRALELIRHDCAHVLAEAVQALYPGTQVTIGPVIDNGFFYDFHRETPFTVEDLAKIESKMHQIIAANHPFTKSTWTREDAKAYFAAKGEAFKVELVDAIPEGEELKFYAQGDWQDLCRGPHMTSTGKIGKAFKLTKVAGAYWRGDSSKPMLSRIYGTAWTEKADLDAYLHQLEEAEKRDHRRLGNEMDLFHFQPEAPGSVFWHGKGWTLFQQLITYMRRRQNAAGYLEVNSPDMMDRALWEASGHWDKYQENMFITETEDERVFALKPMNCPGHVQIFKNGLKSYRDLPIKLAEFGKVHRYEPSGALHGLMRVRSFTQDDAHIFITDDQITQECLTVNELILSIYADFGFEDVIINFSTRPEQRVGDDAVWDKAEAALEHAIKVAGKEYKLNPGDGAFYGPKLDYVLRDAIGREWQCGTLQVDLNLPGRLGAFYIDNTSEKQIPVMLHRALFGSLERFTGILIEHHAGRLPLWLSPVQVVVCPITSEQDDYAEEVRKALEATGIRVQSDLRNEKISYKVREHSHGKIPVIMAVGKREADEKTVAIRRLGSQKQEFISLSEALTTLSLECEAPDLTRARQAQAAE